MDITLHRVVQNSEVTLGILTLPTLLLSTCEPPWLDNQKNISCIPPGIYELAPYNSLRFGKTYKILFVPNREGILFHKGNFPEETEGCILLARQTDFSELSIVRSAEGHAKFMEELAGRDGVAPHRLFIHNYLIN